MNGRISCNPVLNGPKQLGGTVCAGAKETIPVGH